MNKNMIASDMANALLIQDLKSEGLRTFNNQQYDFFHRAVENIFSLSDTDKIRADINNLVDIANREPESSFKFFIYDALGEYYAEHIENNDSVDFKVQYHLYSILGPEPFVTGSNIPVISGQLMGCTNFDFILDMRRERIKQMTQDQKVDHAPKQNKKTSFENIAKLIGHHPEFDDSEAKHTVTDVYNVAKDAAKKCGITDSTEFDICPQSYIDAAIRAACEDTYRFAYDNITWSDQGALLAVAEIQLMALSQKELALDIKFDALNNLVTLFKSNYHNQISDIIYDATRVYLKSKSCPTEIKKEYDWVTNNN